MESKAKVSYVRIAPRKARAVIDLIRHKSVVEAKAILNYNPRKAAVIISKVLKSAAANAENNLSMNQQNLFVSRAFVDEGPVMKRVQPRAKGRRNLIRKRLSHITIILEERKGA